ncbi:MAG TPA: endolytic transglycosylase MltG [Ignavibacteria bacterium]|nr:endolytic transglycosylase MltG [Ignavibacteria bacterium]HMR40891.1 endolytic transglycosylase MltG [Ignavibacteria bacterium]
MPSDNAKKYYKLLIPLNILLIVFIYHQLFYSRYFWEGEIEKTFVIEKGKNLDEIVSNLKKENVIANSFLFKLAVKLSGKENQIIANTYLFINGMNNTELISLLTDKDLNQLVKFTVPEGYNLKQISRLAASKFALSDKVFISEASNDSLINILGLNDKVKNLEGFLFPDTYYLSPKISEKQLVNLLFNEFRKNVTDNEDLMSKMNLRKFTILETITLASIIEGETKLVSEKPIIAGVYINRLNKGMKLEADPTIQYILPDGPKNRLLFSDLKIKSPYNTYLNKGLPPGPINNPGMSSIEAALNPEDHNYIFFVATGDGGHKFTENYEQHKNAILEYKAKLRELKKQKQSGK